MVMFYILWGFVLLLVNSYVSYKTFILSEGVKPQDLIYHNKLQNKIVIAYIKPESHQKRKISEKKTAGPLALVVNMKTKMEEKEETKENLLYF